MSSALFALRRRFYRAGGPYIRARLAEVVGWERWSWPALHGLDRRVDELLQRRRGGNFLEAGAHDGFTQSMTWALERRRGWRGVLVEPIPELYAKAVRRRPRSTVIQAALVGPEQAGKEVTVAFGDLMSQVADTTTDHAAQGLLTAGLEPYMVRVRGRTLDDILDETGVTSLDLLVLDVEGHEPEVLRGLDAERHPVEHLVVEVLEPRAQLRTIDAVLGDRFELAGMLTHCDAHYVAR